MQERVIEALTVRPPGLYARNPFFHPDNFTFGTPLYRAALEAAVQAVPGVLAVEEIRIRVRGLTDWRLFDENVFTVSDDQILRVAKRPALSRPRLAHRPHSLDHAHRCLPATAAAATCSTFRRSRASRRA